MLSWNCDYLVHKFWGQKSHETTTDITEKPASRLSYHSAKPFEGRDLARNESYLHLPKEKCTKGNMIEIAEILADRTLLINE